MTEFEGKVPFVFNYVNYRNELSERQVYPISVRYGSTEWHPEEQWLMLAYDIEKKANREFAMKDIVSGDGFTKGYFADRLANGETPKYHKDENKLPDVEHTMKVESDFTKHET